MLMDSNEILHTIALTQIKGVGLITAKRLCEHVASVSQIFENRSNIRDIVPDASDTLVALLQDSDDALARAEQELEFIEQKNMRCIIYSDPDYPQRLLECDDAPLALFSCGSADLNPRHVVSIVGTRRCTNYGKDVCRNFIAELKEMDPGVLIVSGLAYGIDVCAHKESLRNGLQTVGVLAHGLDTVYPRMHRQVAVEMIKNGGLLTEYLTNTTPEKGNFVQRNRIVAGMSDATIVVESAERGGSLITANLAHSYGREVFAFPGRVYDEYSKGCNRIIYNDMARSIRSTADLFEVMNWHSGATSARPLQQELFLSFTDDERKVAECMKGSDGMSINQIVAATGLSFSGVSVILFELEGKGVVDFIGGARYRLLREL